MKVALEDCLRVSKMILDIEIEMISRDRDCFTVRDWFDKFGENVFSFADKLVADYKQANYLLDEMAKEMQDDFESGWYNIDAEGGLYHYTMPSDYSYYLDKHIEIQLGNLTGVGTQMQLELNY